MDYKDVWTIPIGLLVYLDNQNLDYTPNRVHYHLDYIRQTMLNCAMYFVLVVQNSPNGDSPNVIGSPNGDSPIMNSPLGYSPLGYSPNRGGPQSLKV